MINREIINKIKTVLSGISLGDDRGRFLADKSYGYDTIFFIAKFLCHNSRNNEFNKGDLKRKAIEYIEDIFQLIHGTPGAQNYYHEAVNLLTYGNILRTSDEKTYTISQPEILEFIAECPENSYIFLYLLTYITLENENILQTFVEYANANNLTEKRNIINKIHDLFSQKSISIETSDSNWSKQLVKYTVTVLGYVNKLNYVSRSLNISENAVSIENASLNVPGTRTPKDLPKKNDYIYTFNLDYVKNCLENELLKKAPINTTNIEVENSIANGLAELKLLMLDNEGDGSDGENKEKEQFINTETRQRNPQIQAAFRRNLLDNNEHVCPICKFSFESLLTASHIKPYAKCDNTYDAINHYNGFLMCPVHDKLFEDARYMTIDYRTGQIILSKEAKKAEEFKDLDGKYIPKTYIENERCHYLEWHNKRFYEQNPQ